MGYSMENTGRVPAGGGEVRVNRAVPLWYGMRDFLRLEKRKAARGVPSARRLGVMAGPEMYPWVKVMPGVLFLPLAD